MQDFMYWEGKITGLPLPMPMEGCIAGQVQVDGFVFRWENDSFNRIPHRLG